MGLDSIILRQYLLGNLAESETERIDLRIIEDGTFSADMSLAESELFEDFLEDTLSPDEVRLFHTNFMTSAKRNKQLNETVVFKNYARRVHQQKAHSETSDIAAPKRPGFLSAYFRPLFAGAALVATVLLVGVVWQIYFSNPISPLEREYAELNRRDLSEVSQLNAYSTVNLSSGSFRNSSSAAAQAATGLSDTVLFRLALAPGIGDEPGFTAKVYRGSVAVFTLSDLRSHQNANGRDLRVLIPKSILQKGQYQIKLSQSGKENSAETYSFSIE